MISYEYKSTNNGNVTLVAPFTVSDDQVHGHLPGNADLAGADRDDHLHRQPHRDAGRRQRRLDHQRRNRARRLRHQPVDSNQDTKTVTADQTPSLHLDKSASPTAYVKGTVITYELPARPTTAT